MTRAEGVELKRLKLERLKRLHALKKRADEIDVGMAKYLNDPVGFANDCIDWNGRALAAYQGETMELLVDKKRASFRSLRGAGKSCTAAITILWFAITREAAKMDWKIVTTAGAWNQLRSFLWPEVHKWAGRLRWDIVRDGRRFKATELKKIGLSLEHGVAIAASCTNAGLIEGAHADELLFVFDEAKLIPAATFDSAEGAMNTGNCYAMMLSTPGEPSGRFYEVQSRQKGYEDWGVKAVTLDEVLGTGQVNTDWVEQRRLQWGEESALFNNHVLGQFFAADEDCVIPLRWAEAAVDRWKQWVADGSPYLKGRRVIAADIARYGTDKTAIAIRQGSMIESLEQRTQSDTMGTTGYIKGKVEVKPQTLAVIDSVGVGGGVVDRLREQGVPTISFCGSAAAQYVNGTRMTDRTGDFQFINMRAASWFMLRESWDTSSFPKCKCDRYKDAVASAREAGYGGTVEIDNNCYRCTGALGIPEVVLDQQGINIGPRLLGDLTSPKWKITSGSKYKVEDKDEIRKRLGRSPDLGDAVVMAAWYSGAVGDADHIEDVYDYLDNYDVSKDSNVFAYEDEVF